MKVKELLSSPEKWTHGVYARGKDGFKINSGSPAADRWCILGAIQKCYGFGLEAEAVVNKVAARLNARNRAWVASWNDSDARFFKDVQNLVEELDI